MGYAINGISLLFIPMAYKVTVNNVKYLLSGFNKMNKAEQKKFDIEAFIPFLRRFHIVLGMSFLFMGLLLTFLLSKKTGAVFVGTYPIGAYIYFIQKKQHFL